MGWELRGGSEKGLSHLISGTGGGKARRRLRSSPEVSSPLQAIRAVQHRVVAWQEKQQFPSWRHRNARQRGRGEESAGNPRGLLEMPSFCSLSEAELIFPHFALWLIARLLELPEAFVSANPLHCCAISSSAGSSSGSVSQDFHRGRGKKKSTWQSRCHPL